MDYYSEMEEMLQEMMQDPMYETFIWVVFAVAMIVSLAIGIVMYILRGVGVRCLCETAGIPRPWLAFVPIARWTMLGKLAELRLPQEIKPRKTFPYSVHLPILMTLSTLMNLVCSVYTVYYGFVVPEDVLPPDRLMAVMNGVSIAYSVINMIATVLLLMALYRVFTVVGSGSPMLMTLLCALIDLCLPIMLFAYRKNAIAPQPTQNGDDSSDDSGFYYDNQ